MEKYHGHPGSHHAAHLDRNERGHPEAGSKPCLHRQDDPRHDQEEEESHGQPHYQHGSDRAQPHP